MSVSRLARAFAALVVAAAALVVGLASLHHPVAGWLPGVARKGDVPPVVGAGLLVVPVVVVGWGVWRLREALVIGAERRQQRRRRRGG